MDLQDSRRGKKLDCARFGRGRHRRARFSWKSVVKLHLTWFTMLDNSFSWLFVLIVITAGPEEGGWGGCHRSTTRTHLGPANTILSCWKCFYTTEVVVATRKELGGRHNRLFMINASPFTTPNSSEHLSNTTNVVNIHKTFGASFISGEPKAGNEVFRFLFSFKALQATSDVW